MENMRNKPLLELEDICFAYGGQQVLNDISFTVNQGEYLSLIGPNGSGKSTLMQIMSGCLTPLSGGATYCGKDIHRMEIRTRAKEFAVIHQNEDNSFPFTCLETVIMGLHPHRARFDSLSDESFSMVEATMRLTDTWQFADKLITQISGGELQRVMLAKALMQRPKVLFLDEAMSGLDIAARIMMTKVFKDLIAVQGITVVAINHDLATAYQFSDRIVALCKGGVSALGKPKEVMTEEFFSSVFGVKAEILDDRGILIHDNISKEEL